MKNNNNLSIRFSTTISLFILFFNFSIPRTSAQNVGINTDGSAPDNSAMLDIKATDRGLLIPRVSLTNVTVAAPVTSPATGLLVYNTNASVTGGSGTGFYFWNGTQWVKLDASNGDWRLTGNSGTNPATNFLGTTDAQPLVIRTNNTEQMRITSGGNVGIGTTAPSHRLHIEGGNLRIRSATNYNLITFNSPGWDPTAFVISTRNDGLVTSIPLSIDASRITLWGNVGIETITPTERLHVAGNLRLDNAFMPGNNAGTAGSLLRSAGAGVAPVWLAPGANGDLLTISGGVPAWTAPSSLGGNFVLNQNATDQTANFRITGTGRANTSFQAPVYTRADAGTVAIRPFSNSTTAVQIQNAGGTSIVNVDATNTRVGIGSGVTAPLATTDIRGSLWLGTNRFGSSPPAQLNFNSDGSGVEINFMPNLYNKLIDVDAVNFDITSIETPGNHTVMRFAANNTATSGFLWRTWDGSAFTSRMWLRGSDGFLGVGTITPTERLHVAGNLRLDNAFMPGNNAGTAGSLLRSAGAGVAPVWLAPGANGDLLTISGGVPAWTAPSSLGGNFILNQNATDQTANFRITGTGRANTSFQAPVYTRADAGTVAIRPFSNSTTAIQLQNAGGTSIVNVDATNARVGIGTVAPYTPLTIAHEASYTFPNPGSSATGAINIRMTTSDRQTGITFSQANVNNAQAGLYVHQDNTNGTHMYLATTDNYATGPQARVTVRNNGNVGIGTITPARRLDVAGLGRFQVDVLVTAQGATEGGQITLAAPGDFTANSENCNSWNIDVLSHSSGSRFRIFRGSAGCSTPNDLQLFNLTYGGNVGILSLDPQERIQVGDRWTFHDGGWKVISYNARYDGAASTWRYLQNDEASSISFTSDGHIYFQTAGAGTAGNPISYANRVAITNGGNVGIDNASPLARLDVRKTAGHGSGTGSPSDAPTTAIITAGATARQNDWPNGWGGGLSTWDICGSSTYMTGYVTRSDSRFKKDVSILNGSQLLNHFMQLKPVSYYINQEQLPVDDPERMRYGFLADEVEKIFPNMVVNAGLPATVARGLEYDAFIPVLVTVVQQQQTLLQQQQKEIEALKKKLEEKDR